MGSREGSTRDDRVFLVVDGVRRSRLLTRRLDQTGATPVEMTFAIILLMTLMLGVVQVAFVLYARNVVMSSAHEGARAAAERGTTGEEAEAVAREVVTRSAGGLVEHLAVDVATAGSQSSWRVTVRVRGVIKELGPIPIAIPLLSTATAQLDEARR